MKLPTFEVDDEFDLIDEDSLLTEEDLKRPELPKGNHFFQGFLHINLTIFYLQRKYQLKRKWFFKPKSKHSSNEGDFLNLDFVPLKET